MADEPIETNDADADATTDDRHDRRWIMWVVLAIVVLVALLLLRDYFGRIDGGSDAGRAPSNSQMPVYPTPDAEAEQPSEPTESRPVAGVPDVVGLMASDAADTLARAGYGSDVTKLYSSDKPRGVVFEQVPAAGSVVDAGTVVRVLVSGGPQPSETVSVPDCLGMKKDAAIENVEARGLEAKVMVTANVRGKNRVYEQSPAAGTMVARGSKVFLLITVPY